MFSGIWLAMLAARSNTWKKHKRISNISFESAYFEMHYLDRLYVLSVNIKQKTDIKLHIDSVFIG